MNGLLDHLHHALGRFDGLLIIPILAILILIHELGHFWSARACKVKVEEFGIGIPPRAKGWERNGVIWSLNWIPFGGFVRVKGEDAGDMSADSMNSKPPLQRAFFLVAGSAMNLLLAIVLIIVLIGFVGVTNDRLYVGSVVPGAPAQAAGIRAEDQIVRVNGEPVSDAQDLTSKINANRGSEVDLTVSRDGQESTVTVVPREHPPAGQGATGVTLSQITEATIAIASVTPGGPAAAAGVQPGDRIVAINGVPIRDSIGLSNEIRAAQQQTATFTVERGGKQIDVPIAVPLQGIDVTQVAVDKPMGVAGLQPGDRLLSFNGTPLVTVDAFQQALLAARGTTTTVTIARTAPATDGSAYPAAPQPVALNVAVPAFGDDANYLDQLGITASQGSVDALIGTTAHLAPIYDHVPALQVIPRGLGDAWHQTGQMLDGLRQLATGQQSLSGLAGPVGMGQLTNQLLSTTAESPLVALTRLMILLSLNLAVLNLLPFPALDGGRLLFVIIEMVRGGRKISPEKEGIVHFAGLVVLLLVMFVVAFNDIRRIVEGNSFF